jgi:hypothetical protein
MSYLALRYFSTLSVISSSTVLFHIICHIWHYGTFPRYLSYLALR